MIKELDIEEDFHAQDPKKWRKERKEKKAADRSKYKKTDLKQIPKTSEHHLPKGRVIAIRKEGIWVDGEEERFLASLQGKLKKEKTRAKNLVAVGDFVRYTKEKTISHIDPRYSFLARTDITGRKEQLIAVNIDLAVIVVSIVSPVLKPALVDRYLIAAKKGNISPVVVVNKIDLLEISKKDEKEYKEFLFEYEKLGIPILSISSQKKIGLEPLKAFLKDKVSVFSGQSGVGKSSLLNTAFNMTLKTGEVVQKTLKGVHTTTTAELLSLPEGGYAVDTPGIRSFGVWDLKLTEVMAHFHDFHEFPCKFPDCSHESEPECGVKKALEEEKISQIRYDSYRTLCREAKGEADNRTSRRNQ